jgi:Flagellar hook-length control protein FliK
MEAVGALVAASVGQTGAAAEIKTAGRKLVQVSIATAQLRELLLTLPGRHNAIHQALAAQVSDASPKLTLLHTPDAAWLRIGARTLPLPAAIATALLQTALPGAGENGPTMPAALAATRLPLPVTLPQLILDTSSATDLDVPEAQPLKLATETLFSGTQADPAAAALRLQAAVLASPVLADARAESDGRFQGDPAGAARLAAVLAEGGAALPREALQFSLPAWPQQEAQLEIEREPGGAQRSDPVAALFTATLRLELPQLGVVSARLRLLDRRLAVQIESGQTAALADGLPALEAALRAASLEPAALHVTAVGTDDEAAR